MNKRSERKDQHVEHALNQNERFNITDFSQIQLIHQSVPDIDLESVDLKTSFGDFTFKYPVYINAMTGGSEWTKTINEKLAMVAHRTELPMAVGSMHAALKDPSLASSYEVVREQHPDGIVFANIGADLSLDKARHAVEMIDADALQIHVNAAQELIMPEGDRNFKDWKQNISEIVSQVDVPVIVKEVGFGMSSETLSFLKSCGVKYADVSGRGGTNFADIENARREKQEMNFMSSWGLTTVTSLVESQNVQDDLHILASGGVKTPLDVMKCLAIGANAVGMSRTVLEKVQSEGVDNTVDFINMFIHHLKVLAVLVSAKDMEDIKSQPVVYGHELMNWKAQRQTERGNI